MAVTSKEDALRALGHTDNHFITQNLESINSLHRLAEMLGGMRDDVYIYHVSPGCNHFSDWVRNVFGDAELANNLFSVSRPMASHLVSKRIQELENMANSPQDGE